MKEREKLHRARSNLVRTGLLAAATGLGSWYAAAPDSSLAALAHSSSMAAPSSATYVPNFTPAAFEASELPVFTAAPMSVSGMEVKNRQLTGDLDELYAAAGESLPRLNKFATKLGAKFPGAVVFTVPLKGRGRTLEKIRNDYHGDASRIKDLARAAVAFVTREQVLEALERIQRSYNPAFKVLKIKNNMDNVGYKDVNLSLLDRVNGHIVELQLHLACILDAKKQEGNKLYHIVRNTTDVNLQKMLRDLETAAYLRSCSTGGRCR
jgi:hypothetical protein